MSGVGKLRPNHGVSTGVYCEPRWVDHRTALTIGFSALALCAGAAVAVAPEGYAVALGMTYVAGPPAAYAVVKSARARLVSVLLGALVVFQSQASAGKYAYLGLVFACFVVSAASIVRSRDPITRQFRPLLLAGVSVVGMLAVSFVVSCSQGSSVGNAMSDMLPYLLIATLPVVGIDAAVGLSERAANLIVGGVGLVSAFGFSVDWLDRRGVSGLGIPKFMFSSTAIPALGFTYAIVQAARGRQPLRWGGLALAIAALMLVTGTRTNLVLVFAFVGIVGLRSKARLPIWKVAGAVASVGGVAALVVPFLAGLVIEDPRFFSSRVAEAMGAAADAASDQSYLMRQHSYEVSQTTFAAHPWFGVGPGHLYEGSYLSLDTPWQIPAKYGVIGTCVLIGFLVAVVVSVSRIRRLVGFQSPQTVARGWLVVLVALTPFGPWPEDKGTALGLALLLALIASDARRSTRSHQREGQVPDSGVIPVDRQGRHPEHVSD